MLDALDLDGGDGRALDRGQERAPERVADGRAEAAFERLGRELPVALRQSLALDGEPPRHLKTRPEVVLIHCHSHEPSYEKKHPNGAPHASRAADPRFG